VAEPGKRYEYAAAATGLLRGSSMTEPGKRYEYAAAATGLPQKSSMAEPGKHLNYFGSFGEIIPVK
jgi:hypothetical protein